MRVLVTILMLMISMGNVHANAIDSLFTKAAVQKFLADNFGKRELIFLNRYANLSKAAMRTAHLLFPKTYQDTIQVQDPVTNEWFLKIIEQEVDSDCLCCKEYTESLVYSYDRLAAAMNENQYHFHKVDVDGNGYTDLIVEAGSMMVFMDMAGRLEGHILSMQTDSGTYDLPNYISLPDGTTGLLVRSSTCESDSKGIQAYKKVDTVVYKFNGFVKYNPEFKPAGISKINYQFIESYGITCDGFTTMEINNSGQCFLKYSQYMTVFSGTAESKKRDELWRFISYVNVKSKEDVYFNWTDHADGCKLTVYFEDGTMKRIYAWDCSPSRSFNYLTKCIADISNELHWQPAEKPANFEYNQILPNSMPIRNENSVDCGCTW